MYSKCEEYFVYLSIHVNPSKPGLTLILRINDSGREIWVIAENSTKSNIKIMWKFVFNIIGLGFHTTNTTTDFGNVNYDDEERTQTNHGGSAA